MLAQSALMIICLLLLPPPSPSPLPLSVTHTTLDHMCVAKGASLRELVAGERAGGIRTDNCAMSSVHPLVKHLNFDMILCELVNDGGCGMLSDHD